MLGFFQNLYERENSSYITYCLFLEIKKGCMNLIYNEYYEVFKIEKNNLRGFNE